MDTTITKEYFDITLSNVVNNAVKGLVTKEDLDLKLKNFATKDDLKGLETRIITGMDTKLHNQKVELMEYIDDRITLSEDKITGMTARALDEIRQEMSV